MMYVELFFIWGEGYVGWEGVVCLFVLFWGQKCCALGTAGVQGAVFGGDVLLCRCDSLGRGCRQMLWCGALGDQEAGLSHSLSSREDDYTESLHQTEAVSCFSKGRAPVPAGAVLELTQ